MSVPGIGHKCNVLFAKESTYGTAPGASTNKWEFASFRPAFDLGSVIDGNMNSASPSPRLAVQTLQVFRFTTRMRWAFEGYEALMRMLLPTYSQATVESGVIDHTFKEGFLHSSCALDVSLDNIPSGQVLRCTGCKALNWSFTLTQGQGDGAVIYKDIEWLAQNAALVAPMTGTPTIPVQPFIPFHATLRTSGNIKDALIASGAESSAFIRSLRVSMSNPHTVRGYLGSQLIDEPVRNGQTVGRIDLELQWDANYQAAFAKALANTLQAGGLKFLLQHATTIGAASKREYEITAANPFPEEYPGPEVGIDVITQRIGYRLLYDATALSSIVVRNRSTTAALP
jgi:hypothetical protein